MPDISANRICRENVPVVWMLVKERLVKVISEEGHGELEATDLFDSLICGKSQLWILNDRELNIRLVAITRIISYPKVKRLLIDILVGEGLADALPLIKDAESWATQYGATQTEVHARPGLAKILMRKEAFNKQRVVLLRDIANAHLSEPTRKMEQG